MLDELKLPSRNASAGFPDHPHRCALASALAPAGPGGLAAWPGGALGCGGGLGRPHGAMCARRVCGAPAPVAPTPVAADRCRGFETCSIVLSGRIRHEDSVGNKGVIGPGGVQVGGAAVVDEQGERAHGRERSDEASQGLILVGGLQPANGAWGHRCGRLCKPCDIALLAGAARGRRSG